jgi:hypothetical protein
MAWRAVAASASSAPSGAKPGDRCRVTAALHQVTIRLAAPPNSPRISP